MIKKHSIMWFYLFTFIFAVILGGTGQAICTNYVPKQYQTIISLVMAQMAPAFGTLLVCRCMKDWDCFKNMNWNPFKNIKNILWLLLSLMIPATVIAAASGVMSAFGKTYITNGYSNKLIIITVLGSLIGCIGEEIGWRGFMLPSFKRRYSFFSSAVFTGILWGAWHFSKLISFGFIGYLLFILLITELSVVMSWIYSKSSGNMICMVLFHLGINTSSILLLTEREGIVFYTVACVISALICIVIISSDRKNFSSKFSTFGI